MAPKADAGAVKLALKAAQRADELSQGKDPGIADTLAKAYFDAVNKGHLTDDLLDFMTDDVTWWIQKASPSAGVYEGKAGVKRLFSIDIPIFTARPSSRDLWTSGGEIVPDFFGEASMSVVHRRLRSLGEADLARQTWFVEASLSTFSNASTEETRGHGAIEPCGPCGEPSRDRLLAAVRAIGNRLEAVALRGDLDASWIGLNLDRKRH